MFCCNRKFIKNVVNDDAPGKYVLAKTFMTNYEYHNAKLISQTITRLAMRDEKITSRGKIIVGACHKKVCHFFLFIYLFISG
jgi:hypothetical protein